jgi:hypothetical protein
MQRVEPREIIALGVERFRLGRNDGAGLRVDFDMRTGALSGDFQAAASLSFAVPPAAP